MSVVALDKHYSCKELAKLWAVSQDMIRTLFGKEPGVLKIVRPARRGKRQYISLRIPESVALKVHADLHGKVAA